MIARGIFVVYLVVILGGLAWCIVAGLLGR